jgi:peptide/nickel transport system ATP-binding protein
MQGEKKGPVLEVHDLTKIFSRRGQPSVTAVDRVSFSLMPGECLGIIGESGSGKSTLVNMITRLIDADSGQIFLKGRDITRLRGRALRSVYSELQMVFQQPADSFDPRRTLGHGIGESLRNSGWSSADAAEEIGKLLEGCGLAAAFAGRYPHEVSGGQCQRAAIARALAIRPSILLCDEATSALDVTVQQEILSLLQTLRRQQGEEFSILFICHDIALVQQFCDRVLVMYQGRIVEEGIPDNVIQNPSHPYTKRLIDSIL